ncbi:FecR domain-containing protein [bacterium]|nr:FecR domain-containing protein [bacterium]
MKTACRNLLLATLLLSTTVWADEPILRVLDLKTPSGATGQIQHRTVKDKQWYQAYVGTTGVLRDHFKTSPETVAALEFFIGGRVGVNKDTEIEVVSERSVAGVGTSVQRIILVNGALWLKANPLKQPLEIQTNGGTMAIRGTEFTLEKKSDVTTFSLLEGEVEMKDAQQKLLGIAKPGDVYSLAPGRPPVVKYVDPIELRQACFGGDFGTAMALVNAEMQAIGAGLGQATEHHATVQEKMEALLNKGKIKINLAAPYKQAIMEMPVAAGGVPGGGFQGQSSGVQGMQPSTSVTSLSTFQWQPVNQADGYVLFVSGDDQFVNQIVFSARTRDALAVYPGSARPLVPGMYYWRVIPVDSNDQPLPGTATQATFRVNPG